MSRFSVSMRLALVVGAAIAVIIALVVVLVGGQMVVSTHGAELDKLKSAKALLNHVDTREAELKVDAYRSVIETDTTDIRKDLPDDLASVTDTLAELERLGLSGEIATQLSAVKPDVLAFNTFVSDYVALAAKDKQAALADEPKIAERNSAVDDKLGAIHETLDAQAAVKAEEFASTEKTVGLVSVLIALIGLLALLCLAVPLARSITRPLTHVREVLGRIAQGDLTARADLTSSDEIGAMARSLDEATAATQASMVQMVAVADALAQSSGELSTVSGQIMGAA